MKDCTMYEDGVTVGANTNARGQLMFLASCINPQIFTD